MEQLWNEDHGGPSTATWLHESYHESIPARSFWQLTVADPGPDDLFDWAVYERGAMTLAALRHRIGHDDFAHLLQAWTSRHRHGHGTTAQFEALASQHQRPGPRVVLRRLAGAADQAGRHRRQRALSASADQRRDQLRDPALAAGAGLLLVGPGHRPQPGVDARASAAAPAPSDRERWPTHGSRVSSVSRPSTRSARVRPARLVVLTPSPT